MIHVIDYGRGNLKSVCNAFRAIGEDVCIAGSPSNLEHATAIVLPGVGAFDDGMRCLKSLGFVSALNEHVIHNKTPFLGICLGMQFLAHRSEEGRKEAGLGWMDGEVRLLKPHGTGVKVPHMGWNTVSVPRPTHLFEGLDGETTVYFVHSYHVVLADAEQSALTATTEHGCTVTAAIQREHIFGVQFHPEKSQGAGLRILENFAAWGRKTDPDTRTPAVASAAVSVFQGI